MGPGSSASLPASHLGGCILHRRLCSCLSPPPPPTNCIREPQAKRDRISPHSLALLAQRTTPPLKAPPNPGPHFVGSPLTEPSSNYSI